MNKKNIIFNMTLEQYNKRYKNRRCHLLKFTKKEVNEFSKKNNVEYKFFLESRKWALIGDTYYEIPKPIRFTWFRNLNACVQASVCLLGAAVVATAITVPTVLSFQNKEVDRTIDITGGALKDAKPINENGNLVFDLTCSNDKHEITEVTKITIGNIELSADDYIFDKANHKLTIKKSALEKVGSNDNIQIVVVEKEKGPVKPTYVTKVECDSTKTMKVGNILKFDDLHVVITPDDATDKTFRVEEGGQLNSNDIMFDIDNDAKTIKAKTSGEGNIWVIPNGIDPEGEEMIVAICVITVEN